MQFLSLNLPVSFHPGNLRAFRAAIAELVGYEQELFHNHDNRSSRQYHWDYPLIQYRVRRGKLQIIGIAKGAQAIKQQLLPRLGTQLQVLGQKLEIPYYEIRERQIHCDLLPQPRLSGLRSWLALNKKNYHAWSATNDPDQRAAILDQALTGHLRVLAKGLGFTTVNAVHGKVLRVDQRKRVHWKRIPMIQFHALIECNLELPPEISLGRLSAYGYGELLTTAQYAQLAQRLDHIRQTKPLIPSKR